MAHLDRPAPSTSSSSAPGARSALGSISTAMHLQPPWKVLYVCFLRRCSVCLLLPFLGRCWSDAMDNSTEQTKVKKDKHGKGYLLAVGAELMDSVEGGGVILAVAHEAFFLCMLITIALFRFLIKVVANSPCFPLYKFRIV
uniref:Uncharacterized protein n=2 Tax=Triticum urartu TaxID=4572 RepID=A0A8R7TB11_TRIUA